MTLGNPVDGDFERISLSNVVLPTGLNLTTNESHQLVSVQLLALLTVLRIRWERLVRFDSMLMS